VSVTAHAQVSMNANEAAAGTVVRVRWRTRACRSSCPVRNGAPTGATNAD